MYELVREMLARTTGRARADTIRSMASRATKHCVRILVLAAVAAATSVNAVGPAQAYTLTGCKYASKTIQYGTTTSGLQSTFDTAASRWSSATDVTLNNINGSVVVGINVYGGNYGNVGWDGQTSPVCSGSIRTTAAIKLNKYYTDGYATEKRRGVAVHEFGHALGLNHVSSTGAVMYGDTPGRTKTSPATDDIKGVNYLY